MDNPLVPNEQVTRGANPRLPPEIQQFEDVRAGRHRGPVRYVSDDGSVNIYISRSGNITDLNHLSRRLPPAVPRQRDPYEDTPPNIPMLSLSSRDHNIPRVPNISSTRTDEPILGMIPPPVPNITSRFPTGPLLDIQPPNIPPRIPAPVLPPNPPDPVIPKAPKFIVTKDGRIVWPTGKD